MKKSTWVLLILISILYCTIAKSQVVPDEKLVNVEEQQTPNSTLDYIILEQSKAIANWNEFNFTVTTKLKAFGKSTIGQHNLEIFAKKNPQNLLYNYDWVIREKFGDRNYTIIFQENTITYISHNNKAISVRPNIVELEKGFYYETMREFGLFDQVIFFYPSSTYKDFRLDLTKSNEDTLLIVHEAENVKTELWINKQNYYPTYRKLTMQYQGLEQTITAEIKDLEFNQNKFDQVVNILQADSLVDYTTKVNNPEEKVKFNSDKPNEPVTEGKIKLLRNTYLKENKTDSLRLIDLNQDLILIDFWYLGCGPCLLAVPEVQRLHEKYNEKGLQVVALNCIDKKYEDTHKALQKLGASYTNYHGHRSILKQLGIRAFPTVVLLNKEGKVLYTGQSTHGLDSIIDNQLE